MNFPARVDIVIPDGNETDFIHMALSLGYDSIVFLSDNQDYVAPNSNLIAVKTAFLAHSVMQINRASKNFDYIIGDAKREMFDSSVDMLLGVEDGERDTFHYRSTPLNHVHASLAKDNGSIIVFDFSRLLSARPFLYLGRMQQNVWLAKKFSLQCVVFSMARSPVQMRSRAVLNSLLPALGL